MSPLLGISHAFGKVTSNILAITHVFVKQLFLLLTFSFDFALQRPHPTCVDNLAHVMGDKLLRSEQKIKLCIENTLQDPK